MTTPVWVPRKRRGAELFLTALAVFIGLAAYASVGLGVEGRIPADTYKLGGALIVVAIATHLIVNTGTREELRARVEAVYAELVAAG